MNKTVIPAGYSPLLGVMETQKAIKKLKDFFQANLSEKLNLYRVSAPLFVDPETGLNDNLNGVERRVSFTMKDNGEKTLEVVQSLAKWKRMALKKYEIEPGYGIYTDMNAIRRDEEVDNLHSIYVDQWDWERVVTKEQRTKEFLHGIVKDIYSVLKETGDFISGEYEEISIDLPEEIFFITTQELEDMYPAATPKEREHLICKDKGAVFIEEIGGLLASGMKHDGRSPDYDDWKLNGDIILWNDVLKDAFEISSMGIRVDSSAMEKQLKEAEAEDRKGLPFHTAIIKDELPLSIGGGIGQSRLCMYFLKKAHIGEVQASVWPDEMIEECKKGKIYLL